MAGDETLSDLDRDALVEEFGEERVEHTEWWAAEMQRAREVRDAILAAIDDREDARVAKRGMSVSPDGRHEVRFTVDVAGEPFRASDDEVYVCPPCRNLQDRDVQIVVPGGTDGTVWCPHCHDEMVRAEELFEAEGGAADGE